MPKNQLSGRAIVLLVLLAAVSALHTLKTPNHLQTNIPELSVKKTSTIGKAKTGSTDFDYKFTAGATNYLTKIYVRAGDYVNGITLEVTDGNTAQKTTQAGNSNGD